MGFVPHKIPRTGREAGGGVAKKRMSAISVWFDIVSRRVGPSSGDMKIGYYRGLALATPGS
jgi:hypothetical protein